MTNWTASNIKPHILSSMRVIMIIAIQNYRTAKCISTHDDVIKWKHFPRYWPFLRGIHRPALNENKWHLWVKAHLLAMAWRQRWMYYKPVRPKARWHHHMGTFSALLALCAGNSPVTGEFPAQRPVTRSFDVFLDLCLNIRLKKQSWDWWFETLSRPLWPYCNVYFSKRWCIWGR